VKTKNLVNCYIKCANYRDTMMSGTKLPRTLRGTLPRSSVLRMLVTSYQTTQHHIPKDQSWSQMDCW